MSKDLFGKLGGETMREVAFVGQASTAFAANKPPDAPIPTRPTNEKTEKSLARMCEVLQGLVDKEVPQELAGRIFWSYADHAGINPEAAAGEPDHSSDHFFIFPSLDKAALHLWSRRCKSISCHFPYLGREWLL